MGETRKVEVLPYNPGWYDVFQKEEKKIKSIFKDEIINIYHIGSTSIPGLPAKPIIDILVEVRNLDNVDSFNSEMQSLGYEAKGEHGIPDRRFFRKGGNNRTHHVHVFETGNDEIERHLNFRDYLISHPKEAKEYGELKKELAKLYPDNIEKYIEGKSGFIQNIDIKAYEWKQNLNNKYSK